MSGAQQQQQTPDTSGVVYDGRTARIQFGADGKPTGDDQSQQQQQQQQVAQRPANIPEKYWDAEKGQINLDALLKSNADMQAEINRLRNGQQKQQQAAPQQGQQQQDAPQQAQQPTQVDIKQIRAEAAAEFMQNGELSDATYAKLEQAGFDRETVDAYIDGWKARQERAQKKLFDTAKVSREDFDKAAAWARTALTQDEIASFNERLADPITAAAAIAELHDRYTKESLRDGKLVTGNPPSGPTGDYFKSKQEMIDAIKDARYKTDPAYRKSVEEKILNAELAGVNLYM